ncbi:MAG: hypothetical protein AAF938_13545 [Myxococcota bacterium]
MTGQVDAALDVSPPKSSVLVALLVLARSGPLPERWDALLRGAIGGSPAQRIPDIARELLASLPPSRRDPIAESVPLHAWTRVELEDGGVFERHRPLEGWVYLAAGTKERALERFADAVTAWLERSPEPRDAPGHDPFPLARARAFVAAVGRDSVRATLAALNAHAAYDAELIEAILRA